MYELIQAGPRSFYINSPVKIGVYLIDDEKVCLIDSGNDKDAGRKVRQILEREKWSLYAIINTHSNADHIGGNKYLMQQTEVQDLCQQHGSCVHQTSHTGTGLSLRRLSV